jgi:LPXTG-site transpeptidase (sortase) family protein
VLPPERIDPLATTDSRAAPPTEAPAKHRADRGRAFLRGFGIVCLVLAAGIAGFVWWTLWGTGFATARAQAGLRTDLHQQVAAGSSQGGGGIGLQDRPILQGKVYAEIRIPAIQADYYVVQGTTVPDLEKGPGHYVQTADPWEHTGTVGIAGHRTTYLHPFQNLDHLHQGDAIQLVTRFGSFDYRVARVYVVPEAGSGKVLAQTKRPTLVLTTCNPEYSSYQRLIVAANRI